MIRIESTMLHAVAVPLRPEQGNKSPMLVIPAAVGGKPGVLEIAELDAVTIARLKWHYDRRPTDGNAKNQSEVDENGESRFKEIGLLKITVLDGSPTRARVRADENVEAAPLHGQSTQGLEPPRKAKPKRGTRSRKVA